MSNRSDLVAEIIEYEQVAQVARERASELRKQLTADAQAEWHEHGAAPTWRMDAGVVTLPIRHDSIIVADPDALTKWCAEHRPSEVETVRRVREAYVTWLRTNLVPGADEDGRPVAVDPDTGEPVPGMGWEPGGQPGSLSIRPSAAAKRQARALAEQRLRGESA